MSQEVEWNYQVELQDHIHAQVQIQERDNLPKCQYGSQNLEFGQVQMGVLKLNLGFQNNMIPGQIDRVRDIWIGQRLIKKSFLISINVDKLTQLCL